MYRNCCQLLAPSIADASYMSCGMVCSPESQMTMWKPTPCQTDMNRIDGEGRGRVAQPVRARMMPKLRQQIG